MILEGPRFVKVETNAGVKFINVNDIHVVEPMDNMDNGFTVKYSIPGCPAGSVLASSSELTNLWALSQIAGR